MKTPYLYLGQSLPSDIRQQRTAGKGSIHIKQFATRSLIKYALKAMGDFMQNLVVLSSDHKLDENSTPHSIDMFRKNAMAHAAEIAAIPRQI